MKKCILLLVLWLISVPLIIGQTKAADDSTIIVLRKNAFYMEIGGLSVLGSFWYSRIFPIMPNRVAFGAGAGFTSMRRSTIYFLEADMLFLGPRHFIEIGVGHDFDEHLTLSRMGYRYQSRSGFLLRMGYMPLNERAKSRFGVDSPHYVGISFGYSFNFGKLLF